MYMNIVKLCYGAHTVVGNLVKYIPTAQFNGREISSLNLIRELMLHSYRVHNINISKLPNDGHIALCNKVNSNPNA